MNTISNEAQQLLAQMRVAAANAGFESNPIAQQGTPKAEGDFSTLLKGAVDQVNQAQKVSGSLQVAFEKGDPNVSLAEVMIASQKSGLSFDAMNQVRNKLLSAYQEIMRMPV